MYVHWWIASTLLVIRRVLYIHMWIVSTLRDSGASSNNAASTGQVKLLTEQAHHVLLYVHSAVVLGDHLFILPRWHFEAYGGKLSGAQARGTCWGPHGGLWRRLHSEVLGVKIRCEPCGGVRPVMTLSDERLEDSPTVVGFPRTRRPALIR